ncbi:MAG: ABC transporter permease [Acidobacteria bacterium]|nr:ABC transporter permease [Acidobacteriota bacterium]
MKQIIALAKKDLRLMPRNKAGMFFTFAWPIVLMVLFGFAFGGNATSGGAQPKMRIAVIDADNSDASRKFLTGLEASFELTPMTMAEADAAVRLGRRAGYLVVTPGFGAASQRVLAGPSREVELGVDPGRQAEAGMIEGLLMKQAGAELLTRFTSRDGAGEAWQPLKITSKAVAREAERPRERLRCHVPARYCLGPHWLRDDIRHQPGHRADARYAGAAADGAAHADADSRRQGAGVLHDDHGGRGDPADGRLWVWRAAIVDGHARPRRRVGGGVLRRRHDADCQPGQDRTNRLGRRLGDSDAALDARRRHGAAVRHAAVDANRGHGQPHPLGHPGD